MDEASRKFVSTKISSVVAAGLKSHNVLGHPLDHNEETYHESRNKTVIQKEIDKVINGSTPDNEYLWIGFTDKENPHKMDFVENFINSVTRDIQVYRVSILEYGYEQEGLDDEERVDLIPVTSVPPITATLTVDSIDGPISSTMISGGPILVLVFSLLLQLYPDRFRIWVKEQQLTEMECSSRQPF